MKDPDGKVIRDTGCKPARSFVIQFLEFLYAAARGVSTNATDKGGSERTIYYPTYGSNLQFKIEALVNISTYGIVVGTGDTAESNTDYKLATQLTEGITVGKITHGAVEMGSAAVVGSNVDMDITRVFTNNTGSTITVKETGIYTTYGEAYYHCIVRDVLDAPEEVTDKCSITIIYTVRTTV